MTFYETLIYQNNFEQSKNTRFILKSKRSKKGNKKKSINKKKQQNFAWISKELLSIFFVTSIIRGEVT